MSDWTAWIPTALAGLAFSYFRLWMSSEFKDIKASLNSKVAENTCKERAEKCSDEKCRKLAHLNEVDADQWNILNHHGHKGLAGDDNQVVRM
jgi:hypothetical protein